MDTPEVDALQNELGSLTCEEQKPSQLKKLPPCVFIALAQRYLTATQRAALAASERYAREELVKKGEIVWRVTWISQTAAVRMLSTVPPRAYAPLQWTSELIIIDSDTRGVAGSQITRYWKGLALLIANAPALTVLRMRKPWRLSSLVFAAVARRPAMRLEVATLAPERLVEFEPAAGQLVREDRLTCPKLVCDGAWPSWPSCSAWLGLLKQATLVELDLSENRVLVELPEAIATLQSLRVLRANRLLNLRRVAVLARGPPALGVLALNQGHMIQFPDQLACAASLVRLELIGTSLTGKVVFHQWASGYMYQKCDRHTTLGNILDVVEGLPQLRRLSTSGELYEDYFKSVEIDHHPCFVPSALEFLGDLGIFSGYREHWIGVLRGPILDAVPCRKKELELALAAAELQLRETDARELQSSEVTPEAVRSMEAMDDFLACLRAALAGKPYPVAAPSPTASNVDDTAQDAPEESAGAAREDGLPSWASGAHELPMGGLRGVEGPDSPIMSFAAPAYAPPRDHERAWGENVYHAITMMPAYGGKSFEELRLEDYQAAAMSGEGLRAANAAFAALAAERDRLVFRAPSPVAELRVTPDKPFVFGATAAQPPVVTPETHSDKPFAFGANASGREEPFVFGAKLDK